MSELLSIVGTMTLQGIQVTSLLLALRNSFSSVSGLHINILSIYRICLKRRTVQVQVGKKYTRRVAGDMPLNAVKRGLCVYLGEYSTGTCLLVMVFSVLS